nr:MAG TPA: hypothetical protein [Caudoviricetes sp.]
MKYITSCIRLFLFCIIRQGKGGSSRDGKREI